MRLTLIFLGAISFFIVFCHATGDSNDVRHKSNVVGEIPAHYVDYDYRKGKTFSGTFSQNVI